MRTPNHSEEKLLEQKASQLASRGRGSLVFNLLFPLTLILVFSALYMLPLGLYKISPEPYTTWLYHYLKWSSPLLAMSIYIVYSRWRARKLAPFIKALTQQEDVN
jgi:hypothetical protein